MNEIAIMFGLGIMCVFFYQLGRDLKDDDEIYKFLKLMAFFLFFFVMGIMIEYIFMISLAAGHKVIFTRFLTVILWTVRLIILVLGILVIKKTMIWFVDQVRNVK